MPVTWRQVNLAGLGCKEFRIARGPAQPVQPADPGSRRSEQFLLIVRPRDFDHQSRVRIARKGLRHRENGRHRGLIAHEQVPVGVRRGCDLAAGADSLDRVAPPRRPQPALSGPVAVPDYVERQALGVAVERADRVTPPHRSASFGGHQEHHVLARLVPESGQLGGGQLDPLHARRDQLGFDDFERQPSGRRKRASQLGERVLELCANRLRQGIAHAVRYSFVLRCGLGPG